MLDQAQSLRELMQKKNSNTRVITITSGKGGVGKSSFAVNLAIALGRRKKRVLIVDVDLGLANIDVMLGITTQHDLSHVLNGEKDIRDIIVTSQQGIQFISGGSGVYDLIKLQGAQFDVMVDSFLKLGDLADIILFDTGAGVSENILRLVGASNETILITTPEPTAIMDAYALVKTTNRLLNRPRLRLVVNKAENEREALAALDGFIRVSKKYMDVDIDELGYILRDDNMVKAVKMQVPVLVSFPKSVASLNIEQLTERYLAIPEHESQKFSFAVFLSRLIGKKVTGE